MQPIPRPHVLDPDRITSDDREDMTSEEHRSRAQQLDTALHQSCEYAQQLWQHLEAARYYLYDSLPSDPRSPGTDPHLGASPTGPDDEEGWQRWTDAYSAITSVLAGPHGDSGFGLDEARHAARARREAPNLQVLQRIQRGEPEQPASQPAAPTPAGPAAPATAPARSDVPGARRTDPVRMAGLGVLVALAVRGVLPRRAGR